jgi:hypothetical protein
VRLSQAKDTHLGPTNPGRYKSGSMLAEGPIPRFVHGLIEYLAAAALLAAPFLLSFESDAAIAASVIAGVLLLIVAASTDGPTSLINQIPLAVHFTLDWALALALIAVPFAAAFSDETPPTAFFIGLGVLHLLLTIGTRYRPRERKRERKSSRGASRRP